MKISYDKEVDAISVTLRKGKVGNGDTSVILAKTVF